MKWADRKHPGHAGAPEPGRRKLLRAAAALAAGLLAVPAWADPPPRPARRIPWSALNRDEQRLLHDHRAHWDRYSPEQQMRLIEGARRYMRLDPQTRREIERKREQLEHMDPEERARLRREYEKRRQHKKGKRKER